MPPVTVLAATGAAAALTIGAVLVATSDTAAGPGRLTGTSDRLGHPTGWQLVHTVSGLSDLQDTLAVSRNDVWAVGSVQNGAADRRYALALHWDGRHWTKVPLPAPFQTTADPLASNGLSLVRYGGGSLWAFGWAKGGRARYALQWSGRGWVIRHEWEGYGDFTDAVVTSNHDVWTFDDVPGVKAAVGTWHFNGFAWTRPMTRFHLIAAKALSRGDVWGTALLPTSHGLFRPVVTHWDGWAWRALPTPALRSEPGNQAMLTAITATSGSDVWAVGFQAVRGGGASPVALRWNGAEWRRVDPKGKGYGLYSVTPDGRGGVWAAEGNTYSGGMTHFTAGQWTTPTLPRVPNRNVVVRAVSRAPGDEAVWAAGVLVWGPDPSTEAIVLSYS